MGEVQVTGGLFVVDFEVTYRNCPTVAVWLSWARSGLAQARCDTPRAVGI
jgi:metal-sulfur cluster biosynthetic enzyme